MKKHLLVISLILFGFIAQAQESLISEEVREHIKARVDKNINVGIVVGVVDDEKVEYFSYGKTALKNGTDVNENSVFEIGSISKTFTAIMLADEVLKGTMSLSDPIQNYFPETVKVPTRNGKEITLKNLATHSSALPRMPTNFFPSNPNNPYADYTFELAYEFMSTLELSRDIGEKYEYSNFGMGMLGHILELHNDKSYEDLLIERISNVYDMNDTRVVFTESMKERLAKGHSNGREVENWDLPALAGAGAIRSTASDMIKYLKANIGITTSPIYEAIKLSHKEAYRSEEQDFSMGLAWHYGLDDTVIWHNGGTGGYISFAGFLKGTNKGVVVVTNTTESMNGIGLKLLGDTAQLKMPKQSILGFLVDDIDANGIESGISLYKIMKSEDYESYNFDENALNEVGYEYLGQGKTAIAFAIFKLNVEVFPEASNPYDSLGEVYLVKGDSALAKKNYAKSLELNPANEVAKNVLESLGVKNVITEIVVPNDVLDTYAGKYELAPSFIITITRNKNQLFAQATNQAQFQIYASAQNKFYFKVVEANIVFTANEAGKITSLTLYQGGQVLLGKKLE